MATRIENTQLVNKRTTRGFRNPTGQAWEEVAAETIRTEPLTMVAAMETPVTVWGKTVHAVDEVHGIIVARDGTDGHLYYSSDDGATWTQLVTAAELWPGKGFTASAISGDTILVVLGDWAVSTTEDTYRVFRGVWNGTSWTFNATAVHTGMGGSPAYGLHGVGTRWVLGEYAEINSYLANSDTSNVYLSEDDGLTWRLILDRDGYSGTSRHVHDVVIDPDDPDTIWVLYGDGAGNAIKKLARPTPDTGLWDRSEGPSLYNSVANLQPTYGYVRDGKLYATAEYGCLWGKILEIDKSWNTRPLLMLPTHVGGLPSVEDFGPFVYAACNVAGLASTFGESYDDGIGEGIVYRNGAWWAVTSTRMTSTSVQQEVGLYCSTDLEHWTCVYRLPPTEGFGRMIGFVHGKLVCTHVDSNPAASGTAIITLPEVVQVDALVVEKGFENQVTTTPAEASFEGLAAWKALRYRSDNPTRYAEAAGGMAGASMLDYTVASNLSDTLWMSPFANSGVTVAKSTTYGKTPPTNALVTARMWTRRLAGTTQDWISLHNSDTNAAHLEIPRRGDTNAVFTLATPLPKGTSFRQLIDTAKILDQTTYAGATPRWLLQHAVNDSGGAQLQSDCFQVTWDLDRWRSLSASWFPVGGPDNGIMADDWSEVDLAGLGLAWSLSVDWQPLEGSDNFRGDIPILAIRNTAGDAYIELWWDYSSQKFKLVDAGGEVISVSSASAEFRHYDLIRICITSDGYHTRVYLHQPSVGMHEIAAEGIAIGEAPTKLALGTDVAVSNVGCGRFANLVAWTEELTRADAAKNFAQPLGVAATQVAIDAIRLR